MLCSEINLVIVGLLFCFVKLVTCDNYYLWGDWKEFEGCGERDNGLFNRWRIDKRPCYRIDENHFHGDEPDDTMCSSNERDRFEGHGKFKFVVCDDGVNYSNSLKNKYIKQFQYPSGTSGSSYGTPFKFTVPTDGCYKISATGASGSDGPHYSSGATATGVFKLKSGLELTIVVGKHSGDIDGGGGTFVFTVTKDNKRGDLYVVGGGAGHPSCDEVDINCYYNCQDSENGGGEFGGRNGGGGGCYPGYSCSRSGAGWLSSGCGDDSCELNGKSFEDEFVGGHYGGYGGGGDNGGGGYSGGGYDATGGGSFVNSTARHFNKHKNLPTSTRQHGTASIELVDDNQC